MDSNTNSEVVNPTAIIKGDLSLHGHLNGTLTPTKRLVGKIYIAKKSSNLNLATDKDVDSLF